MIFSKLFQLVELRILVLLSILMCISLCVIESATEELNEDWSIWTVQTQGQLRWFLIGWVAFFFFSSMNYRSLRNWSWVLYLVTLVLLLGLFFVPSVRHVHRWYRFGSIAFQPAEYAKLVLVIVLGNFIEQRNTFSQKTVWVSLGIFFLFFLLIAFQPDLGSAVILFPITVSLLYLSSVSSSLVRILGVILLGGGVVGSALFLNIIPKETCKPWITSVLKEYQYARFNSKSYHNTAAETSIALGGIRGSGWCHGEFNRKQWLPAAYTDSVFPSFVEEFGLLGAVVLMGVFLALIHWTVETAEKAGDMFGTLLSVGCGTYLGTHLIINLGMMSGLLPITGVPLPLVSYGGSSVLVTMSFLGIIQSVRRFRFVF
jgi:rod shape determining protein RodA